jgi:hypothetical protein
MRMKSWTYFKQGKSKNLDFIIYIIISYHLLSIVNNTSSSLIAIEPRRKPNFWTIDFEWQALQGPIFFKVYQNFVTLLAFFIFLT